MAPVAVPAMDSNHGADARTFNVEQAIQEFLADPAIMSMRLPHMTTGQRRHAKQVASAHPELKVESFGLGADRYLHLFKKGAEDEVGSKASRSGSEFGLFNPDESNADASPTTDCDSPGRLPSKESSSRRLLPELPAELKPEVRNTFLHIEAPPVDERVVQSMPHGMFRQQLLAESSAAASAPQPPVPPPVMPAPRIISLQDGVVGAPLLAPGTQVIVEGLVRTPEFNGLVGVVQFFEVETGRYSVLLSMPPGHHSGLQWAKLKAENLRIALLPPPMGVPMHPAMACMPMEPPIAPVAMMAPLEPAPALMAGA